MAEVTIESGPQRGTTLRFASDEQLVIGQDEECTLRLKSPGVADQHVVIKALKGGGYGVKKLGGPFLLNGRGTEAAKITEGDILEIGDTRIRFGPKQSGLEGADVDLPGFRLIEVLGKGGHGTVYRAEQMSLHREIALKVLKKEMTKNPEFVGRFVAEARAAARLSHPNVVQVFDVGHHGETYYLSMEIMEHGSLEDRLRRDKQVPVEECLKLMLDAAKGLRYAESMRIVHRDIKPDNLMVDSHGTTKIADLGLAISDDQEQGRIVGTPHFMSPEQVLNKPVDHRSDLYSLGCSFFRLVTGRTLFPKRTTKDILTAHVKSEPETADEVDDTIPAEVADIIAQLVEKDPDDRYQSADELIEDLETALQPPARKGFLIAAIVVLLLGAGYAIYWGATRPEGKNTEKIVKVVDPKMQKELREVKARARYNAIVAHGLSPIELAKSLEKFSENESFAGTSAAVEATAKAADLRTNEAERVRLAKLRALKIANAKKSYEAKLITLIDDGKFREAASALDPTEIPADILDEKVIKDSVAGMRGMLRAAAGARIDRFKAAVEKAKTERKPEEAKPAIDSLVAALDNDKGWPKQAFANRREVANYLKSAQDDIIKLQADIAASRESSAWASFRKDMLSATGVLKKAHSFDLASALEQATKTQKEVAGREAGKPAASVVALVIAAKAYENEFRAAVEKGDVQIPVDVDGAVTDVIVKSFATKGDTPGLTVEIPKDGTSELRTMPLDELRGTRLADVFAITVKAGGTDPAEVEKAKVHRINRTAFLALHVLWEHLDAASKYMSALDPKNPQSGTGDQRFATSLADLNYVLKELADTAGGTATPWRDFLLAELRATRELSRGLRAFSLRRYTGAQGYFENLLKRFGATLAVKKVN